MPGKPITNFDPDPAKLSILEECMADYDVGGSSDAEWPNNILSRKAIVYGSGRIARAGIPVSHSVDPDELGLCQRLAGEASAMMEDVDVGMGSESCDPFHPFFIAGNTNEPTPPSISDRLIRDRFGGTIFPLATITVEPLTESGIWWDEVLQDGEESEADYFLPWRAMIEWFRSRPEFVDSAFVRIGDGARLDEIPRADYPEGVQITGCVLPRLALGLTKQGSLVGLFGFSVQT